jgi:hypothetical protein
MVVPDTGLSAPYSLVKVCSPSLKPRTCREHRKEIVAYVSEVLIKRECKAGSVDIDQDCDTASVHGVMDDHNRPPLDLQNEVLTEGIANVAMSLVHDGPATSSCAGYRGVHAICACLNTTSMTSGRQRHWSQDRQRCATRYQRPCGLSWSRLGCSISEIGSQG